MAISFLSEEDFLSCLSLGPSPSRGRRRDAVDATRRRHRREPRGFAAQVLEEPAVLLDRGRPPERRQRPGSGEAVDDDDEGRAADRHERMVEGCRREVREAVLDRVHGGALEERAVVAKLKEPLTKEMTQWA